MKNRIRRLAQKSNKSVIKNEYDGPGDSLMPARSYTCDVRQLVAIMKSGAKLQRCRHWHPIVIENKIETRPQPFAVRCPPGAVFESINAISKPPAGR